MIEWLTLIFAFVGMLAGITGAVGSIYNAFFIQRPWMKMYLEDREKGFSNK